MCPPGAHFSPALPVKLLAIIGCVEVQEAHFSAQYSSCISPPESSFKTVFLVQEMLCLWWELRLSTYQGRAEPQASHGRSRAARTTALWGRRHHRGENEPEAFPPRQRSGVPADGILAPFVTLHFSPATQKPPGDTCGFHTSL